MNIIGIAGHVGAGKDAAASVLVREFGYVRVGLADPLKQICKEVFRFTSEQLWGSSEARNAPDERYPNGLTPRRALRLAIARPSP
jgi:dephospho-CoA kinase